MILLPPGLRFAFHSRLTRAQARRAARARMDQRPGALDEVWGFAIGRVIFLQIGLVGNPPALFGWIGGADGELHVTGAAGVNLAGLALIAVAYLLIVPLAAWQWLGREDWHLAAFLLGSVVFLYAAAWANHVFRKDAEPLVHLLKRALQAQDLARDDAAFGTALVAGARLSIDEREQDGPPSALSVRGAILGLAPYHFAIVSFGDEHYAQVMNEGGKYRVEWRDGSADRHFRMTGKPDSGQAVAAMVHYLQHRRLPDKGAMERLEFP